MTASNKSELRRTMRLRRGAIAQRRERSANIAESFWRQFAELAGQTIGCYLDVRSEVATSRLIELARARDTRIAVPYCVGNNLEFVLIESHDDLVVGAFGVREPLEGLRTSRARAVERLDAVIVPGLAFDELGYRLGYGRGYYDRTLARRRADAPAIGVAFDCQLVDHVPHQPHDERVDWIVTETRVIPCAPSSRREGQA